MSPFNAYHFVGSALRDGTPIPEDGRTLRFAGKLMICQAGYHASPYVWQALAYANGNTICRVHCAGDIIRGMDKMVCSERTIVSRIDAEPLLRSYAKSCALDVIHLWEPPQIVRDYLNNPVEDAGQRAEAYAVACEATAIAANTPTLFYDEIATYAAYAAASAAGIYGTATVAYNATFVATVAIASYAGYFAKPLRTKQRARLTRMVNKAFENQGTTS